MKRLLLGTLAVLVMAGPLATSAQARSWDNGHERREHGRDRDDDRYERGDGRWDRGDDRREDRREDRHDNRWDNQRDNGYYHNHQWSYGPPPQSYYGNSDYRPGYSNWRRGAALPGYYRNDPVYDWDDCHLRAPPRGYSWYRVGGDYLLAAIATGIIFEIISNQ